MKIKKSKIEIFDAAGQVVYRAYVADPALGLRGAMLESFAAPLAQLQGLDLSNATMYWASLAEADLSFANVSGSDLRGATLDRAICRHTNFRGANLGRDNLGGRTSLRGTDFTDAVLDDANLQDAVFDDATKFPSGFSPSKHGMVHIDELDLSDPSKPIG